jgi:hypothetical protein
MDITKISAIKKELKEFRRKWVKGDRTLVNKQCILFARTILDAELKKGNK